MSSTTSIPLETLASRAGVAREEIDRHVELELVQPQEDGGYSPADVGRVRIINALSSRGIPLQALARAVEDGAVSFSWFDGILPPPVALRDITYQQLFEETGLGVDLARTLFEVWGVALPPLAAPVREDDALLVGYLSEFKTRVEDGEILVEATRYFGDTARRDAESQVAFFRRRILEPLLESGANLKEAIESINPLVAEIIRPGAQELMLWLHRRHIDALSMQMLVETVESALDEAGISVPRFEDLPAVVFIDLSGFTDQTDREGDDRAAELAVRFSNVVRAEVSRLGGSVVKFLGDGVMLHFGDAGAAIRCAYLIVQKAPENGLPPARAGLDVGNLVFRDGDYFGRTVNVASRITDYARPGEVLISDRAAERLTGSKSIALREVGSVALKGVADRTALYTVTGITGA